MHEIISMLLTRRQSRLLTVIFAKMNLFEITIISSLVSDDQR